MEGIGPWGEDQKLNMRSIGQSITVPTGVTTLDTFSFQVASAASINYQAYIFHWAPAVRQISGGVVWRSGILNTAAATTSGFTTFSFAPEVEVVPGAEYALFLTTDNVPPTGSGARATVGSVFGNPYPGGNVISSYAPTFLDLAGTVTFSTKGNAIPEPGTLTLLALGIVGSIAARRHW